MHISMTFEVPADAAGDVSAAVQAALDAHYIKQCEAVAGASKEADAAAAHHDAVVEQLKALRRDIRAIDRAA